MADYTQMSRYYDIIMTSGYYNYDRIVEQLLKFKMAQSLLEIGVGTGLILEKIAQRKIQLKKITGIDCTKSMLDMAEKRLSVFDNIELCCQNVTELSLNCRYEIAFSYGGVWYFVPNENQEFQLISHIADHEKNRQGLKKLAKHIENNGTLLLGIQGVHYDYETAISNGMIYQQKIFPAADGFIKKYYLKDQGKIVMFQEISYFVYSFQDALNMLKNCGFYYHPENNSDKFLMFEKVDI